jgi:SH3-like domain-containing protein
VTVAALIARIRTAPTTSASVTATLRRGVQVSLLERRGEWARVHVDSQRGKAEAEGWIFAASLRQSPRP